VLGSAFDIKGNILSLISLSGLVVPPFGLGRRTDTSSDGNSIGSDNNNKVARDKKLDGKVNSNSPSKSDKG